MEPPSLRLPALRLLPTLSVSTLSECITYLSVLYTPPVRGSRILLGHEYKTATIDNDDELTTLRADGFERAYALRWLTYLLNNAHLISPDATDLDIEPVLARAAALLANCSGGASAGTLTRNLSFPSPEGGQTPLSISLRDIPLENDFASVGAQTWGGACVLAELIVTQPLTFHLAPPTSSLDSHSPLRVLELGAGTGLAGLVFAKAAERLGRSVELVCSDVYPSVLQNLGVNIAANFPSTTSTVAVSVSAAALDYSLSSSFAPSSVLAPPFEAPFDVILGADIIYEPPHAEWVRACVARLLAGPPPSSSSSGSPDPEFHLVIPLRPTHTKESQSVEEAFGFSPSSESGASPRLCIRAKETIVCSGELPNEEVEYAYFRIGWGA
ncbi:hypothetical protein FB45DRAFT_901681 [Roridomyces roridus]|uniref:S-adenosylmethionine-dependent methyltransferase n=1 Tax=Roridomyces roridus TaxID=1738132 RepID=A0AAD7FX80_9AGAR|nr:hypothetical protein FB45DRAFT_901681 [Roridomyces roridus]